MGIRNVGTRKESRRPNRTASIINVFAAGWLNQKQYVYDVKICDGKLIKSFAEKF